MSTGGAYSRNGGSGGRKRSRIRVPGGRPTPTRCGNRAERPKMERALFDFRRKPRSFGRGDRGIHGELFSGGRRTGKGEWKKWHQTGRKKKSFQKLYLNCTLSLLLIPRNCVMKVGSYLELCLWTSEGRGVFSYESL